MEKGCGLSVVEALVDSFGAKFVNRYGEQSKVVLRLDELDEALADGGHPASPEISEQTAARKQAFTETSGKAKAYVKKLEDALERERDLVKTYKDFRVLASKVESWQDATSALTASEDGLELGSGLEAVEACQDALDAQYEKRKATKDHEMAELGELAARLEEFQHAEAGHAAERAAAIGERMGHVEAGVEKYRAAVDHAMERELKLVQQLKEFKSNAGQHVFFCMQ